MNTQLILQLILLVLGFVLLIQGADKFVDGAAGLSAKLGIPQIVIGLTVVAIGTSLPEASVSLFSAIKGNTEITMGNVLGSNIANILLVLGVTALVSSIPVDKPTIRYEIPFLIAITVLLPIIGLADQQISRLEGIAFLLIMLLYTLYLRWRATLQDSKEDEPEPDPSSMRKLIFTTAAGLVMVAVGSDLTVDAVTVLADMAGISERIIALTVIALGTSLPELVTGVVAAAKGDTDIAIGNVVGSNIFNILFVAGLTSVVIPVRYHFDFLLDSLAAIFAIVLLAVILLVQKRIGKRSGIILLLCYTFYLFRILT